MSRKKPRRNPSRARPSADSTAKSKNTRRICIGLILGVMCVVLLAGIYGRSAKRIEPPILDNTEGKIDFAIVAAVNTDRSAVLNAPESDAAWGVLGMRFMAHEFYDQAAVCFEQAAKLSDHEPKWTYLHARCVDQIDPEQAIKLLRKSVAICGNEPPSPRLQLIELLLQQQQLDEAESELSDLIRFSPTDLRARHAKARLLALRGDFQGCVDEIQSIAKQTSDRLAALKAKYQELLKQGHRREAIATRAKANAFQRRANAKQRSLGLLLANAYRNLGRIDDAERQRQIAESISDTGWDDPYYADVRLKQVGQKSLLVKADLLFGAGKYDESNAILKRIVAEYPDTLFGRIYLARGTIRLGRIAIDQHNNKDEARSHFQHAQQILNETLAQNPNAPDAIFRLAVATAYIADLDNDMSLYAEAANIYRRAIDVKSDFTMAYYNLANCLDRSGDLNGAIEAMRGAVRCEPTHVEANAILGMLLSRTDAKVEARKYLQLALQFQPDHALAKQTLEQLGGL